MLRDIKVLHLEPTDVCQAACEMCARQTDKHFDARQSHHLAMSQVLEIFDTEHIVNLDKMFMCGNYGDPAAGAHTLDIYRDFRKINPKIVLGMHSNGALRDSTWWKELATIFDQSRDYVVFSIDGLEDTNAVYRRNVNWSKLMLNVESFVKAGGSAHWDMLVYRHNEHQVEQCQLLAKKIGFKWFRAKVSRRGFTHTLQSPVKWRQPDIKSSVIDCHILKEQSLYIDAQGRVSPCCWLGARQKDFITDFEAIKISWRSEHPNPVCVTVCGTAEDQTNFSSQVRYEIQLC